MVNQDNQSQDNQSRLNLGPVVQSILSLTKSLGKYSLSLTVLTKLIAIIFFAKKMHCKSFTPFSAILSEVLHTIKKLNVLIINDIVS